MNQITAKNIHFQFISDDKLNVSLNRLNYDSSSSNKIQIQLDYLLCQNNTDKCEQVNYIPSTSTEW